MNAGLAVASAALAAVLVVSLASSRSDAAERGRGRRRRPAPKEPKVGDAAPDFTLAKLDTTDDAKSGSKPEPKTRGKDKKETVRLSSFKGKRPVVLVLSSYT